MPMGRLISIEGGDGVGKSTQAALLKERLEGVGVEAVLLREPGGTPLGEELRRLLKGTGVSDAWAELFLFEAARAELVRQAIRPALERGAVVVVDRFADSSTAYQAYGRGLPASEIEAVNRLATGGLTPDLTVLLDMPPVAALGRVRATTDGAGKPGRADPASERRFEEEPVAFHERVAEGFRRLAAREPQRWLVVDATLPREEIAEAIWARVCELLRPG
ncbi:MAG: dTMP kinase [Gemmatimonadetes bacterium]|nr:dTMP kinase [Gemmatimonadota bacterium]